MNAGATEAGCLAHARRKFQELWANHSSTLAEGALKLFASLYDIERKAKDLGRASGCACGKPGPGRQPTCCTPG